MAYTKTNWQTGDVIDATKLNHAEDGIAQAQQTADTANARDSLADLTDVEITGTPTDGQVITYDATNSKWVNGSAGSTSEVSLTMNSNGYLSMSGTELETIAATSKVRLDITSNWSKSALYNDKKITMSASPGTYYLTAFKRVVGTSYRRFYFQGLNNVEYFESTTDSNSPQARYPVTGLNDNNANVLITSPTNGQVLRYDGSHWVNGTAPATVPYRYLVYGQNEDYNINILQVYTNTSGTSYVGNTDGIVNEIRTSGVTMIHIDSTNEDYAITSITQDQDTNYIIHTTSQNYTFVRDTDNNVFVLQQT